MPKLSMRDGARLHYHEVGRGPPVILLHGFAMTAALWLPFALPLAHRFRFVLPDLRGFGGSHRTELSQSCLLSQHADDLADLIDGLGLDGIRLGGLSMGACTALQYHQHYGFERIRSYLHVDQSPCVRNGDDWPHGLLGETQDTRLAPWRTLLKELDAYRDHRYEALPAPLRRRLWQCLGEFLDAAFHHRGLKTLGRMARHERLARTVAPTDNWPVYLDSLRAYLERDYDWRSSLRRMPVPMTVLVGGRSVMYPAAGQRAIAGLVPHARIVEFEDCGHALPFEAPWRFARELRAFLAG